MECNDEDFDNKLSSEDYCKFTAWLWAHRFPMHVTELELNRLLGPATQTFFSDFESVNAGLQTAMGLWMELVLCPATQTRPCAGYITVYREGQTSLLPDVPAPETGPYWIPDVLRF